MNSEPSPVSTETGSATSRTDHAHRLLCLTSSVFLTLCVTASADDLGPYAGELQDSVDKAVEFLRLTQSEDGSWTAPDAVGITALCTRALLDSDVPSDDPAVAKALEYLRSFIQEDGGVYHEQSQHRNYETSISLLAFQAANAEGGYDETIENAVVFLKGLQWDHSEDIDESDPAFGGAGYGKHQRPDLSNTQFFLDALKAAGLSHSDPAIQNALLFVSRCQNLESEFNTTPFSSKVDDGGFYYTPAAGGTSQAGTNPDGGLRSYASMTYAGLKSMIHAGVTADDPRVTAATDWIRAHYTLDENPGLDQQGLFYYYHTFGKALDAMEVNEFEDVDGVRHDWRRELAEHMFTIQQENGSWLNTADRWYEGDPNLVTAYGLMALSYCQPRTPSE